MASENKIAAAILTAAIAQRATQEGTDRGGAGHDRAALRGIPDDRRAQCAGRATYA